MNFWSNLFSSSPPANINYHGLMNQGSTCYLNSVLQVLFMTKDFREAVKRYTEENPDTECIDHDLKDLFKDLVERTTYTYKITRKLGITKVYEQQDAAEYFEKILRLTSPEASKIFHGKLTHETTCCKCDTKSGTTEPFWHLPLALVDSSSKDYSVEDGIQQFFKASEFNGDNQMYCDTCDDKNDATTQYVIRNHPDVLMLLLKRFEFNYYYMKYFKIDRVVAVPYSLQIPEGQTYELYAVVDHFGDLMSGHYAATIKEENGDRWFSFNDTRVTLSNQPFQMENTEKSHNAYLLFYRKKKTDTQHSCTVSHSEVQPTTRNINDQGQDAQMIREEGEVDADDGNDTAASVPNDRNGPEIVSVVSVEAPPPGRWENVENPDNKVDVRQTEQDSRQDHDSYHGGQDECVDKQGSDEGKEMEDDEENVKEKAEADDQEVNRQLICTKTTSVEDQEKAVIQKNREESEEESLVEDQQQDNGELVSVRHNRNEHQDSKQRTGHYVKTRRPMSVERVSVEKNEDTEIITYRLMQKGKHSGNDERVDDTRQKERTDYPECKREISDTSRNISLGQMDPKVDSRRRDEHVQSRGSTVHCSVYVEDNGRSHERQKQEVRHSRGDLRQGLSGSRGPTQIQEEIRDQGRHHGPDEKSVRHSSIRENKEGGAGHSKPRPGKRTHSDTQRSLKTKQAWAEVEDTAHRMNSGSHERISDQNTDGLTKDVSKLNLNESTFTETQTQGHVRHFGNKGEDNEETELNVSSPPKKRKKEKRQKRKKEKGQKKNKNISCLWSYVSAPKSPDAVNEKY
ncbi:ubiquitin carboxyl-terminal hydrolase 19-like isoform X6 [Mugil cephalus]|uniref:ubiquitin carboxyl-terminal hydrolase 19-like isoform X6 n=1 Tax=Mugil cephalus TaxID=48193 RepID=UPI001FB78E83|nr:ubiquitin carboxyl-terminal hydrolase 19-like isoform X6 [Mugil cephalus]